MNELELFRFEENEVRVKKIEDEIYFNLNDVCKILDIANPRNVVNRLSQKGVCTTDTLTKGGVQQATFINESNLYKVIFQSRKPNADKFTDWVTSEVLPSIRKHGAYMTESTLSQALLNPDFIIQLANNLKSEQEAKRQLQGELDIRNHLIAEFQPIKEYVDEILSSTKCVLVTQIAADYGMSAIKLNKILEHERLQRKVNKQWVLYSNHMNKGYTQSQTFPTENGEVKMHTLWTQKGRLKIHEILTNLGYHAEVRG